MSSNDASIAAVVGGSGSGKSAYTKWLIGRERPARLLVWDTMDEYREQAERVDTMVQLVARVRGRKTFALRYVPQGGSVEEKFEVFCKLAYGAGGALVVVEELQTVTKPGWSPAAWSDCTLRGRHQGLRVVGISQRPASVDKNFFSCATFVWCGRMNFSGDVSCMANVLALPGDEIRGLKALEFRSRDMTSGEGAAGKIKFLRGKPHVSGSPR